MAENNERAIVPAGKRTIVRFYARVIRKDQMKIEDVEPELREYVRQAIADLDAAEKESGENNG